MFPLVAYPGLAPELALRSGMGAWEPYGLAAPSDRLLPFVLSRRLLASNSRWLNCAWVEHAESGARIATLVPTGAPAAGGNVVQLGLVVSKQVDNVNGADYFLYDGALIPSLNLPCGVPLRLVVDNAYQSPRFYAWGPAAELRQTHLQLDWYHDGPMSSVPYGHGFRQRLYVDNGALQFDEPCTEKVSSKNPDTGAEVLQSLAQYAVRSFVVEPVPTYLADAVSVAQAPKFFLADGEAWRLTAVKSSPVGTDGGRWTLTGTLEDQQPLLRRGCYQPALEVQAYDPATDAPRGWRCGDRSDRAPDYGPTGEFSCELGDNQRNTGYLLEATKDLNRYSPTYGQAGPTQRSASPDLTHCPVATLYGSQRLVVYATKNDCGDDRQGTTVELAVEKDTFQSADSQEAADLLAQQYADATKQRYANDHGSCNPLTRRVCLTGYRAQIKQVVFSLARTDAVGELRVTVLAQAVVDTGSGLATQQFVKDFVIPAGTTSLLNATIGYNGGVLAEFQTLEISAVSPADYQF
jgi:hypothetical protein